MVWEWSAYHHKWILHAINRKVNQSSCRPGKPSVRLCSCQIPTHLRTASHLAIPNLKPERMRGPSEARPSHNHQRTPNSSSRVTISERKIVSLLNSDSRMLPLLVCITFSCLPVHLDITYHPLAQKEGTTDIIWWATVDELHICHYGKSSPPACPSQIYIYH